jgi:hypothetical protein
MRSRLIQNQAAESAEALKDENGWSPLDNHRSALRILF